MATSLTPEFAPVSVGLNAPSSLFASPGHGSGQLNTGANQVNDSFPLFPHPTVSTPSTSVNVTYSAQHPTPVASQQGPAVTGVAHSTINSVLQGIAGTRTPVVTRTQTQPLQYPQRLGAQFPRTTDPFDPSTVFTHRFPFQNPGRIGANPLTLAAIRATPGLQEQAEQQLHHSLWNPDALDPAGATQWAPQTVRGTPKLVSHHSARLESGIVTPLVWPYTRLDYQFAVRCQKFDSLTHALYVAGEAAIIASADTPH